MTKNLYLILLSLLPLFSIAQSNYKPGYVLNGKGDTLRGYIDQKEWGRNPQNINFKSALDSKSRKIGINEIAYFTVSGIVSYQKFSVKISLNPIDISSAPSIRDTAYNTDTVLLRIVERGKYLTLYGYVDGIKPRYYISENNATSPIELVYGIYESPANPSSAIEVTTYKDQLSALAAKYVTGSNKLTSEISYTKYTEPDLLSVVAKINGDAITQEASFSGKYPRYRLFAGAAYERNTLKYTGDSPLSGASPSTTSVPKITAGIDIFVNPSVGHLIFRLEAAYSNHTGYQFKQVPDSFVIIEGSARAQMLSQSTFSLTPQAIFNLYNSEKLKVFVDIGYNINFSSYNSTIITRDASGSSSQKEVTSGDFAEYAQRWGDPQFKAGVIITKKLEIYGSYNLNAPINNYGINYSLRLSSYQFGLNYFIK